jgi:hypothetical protein
VFLRSQAHLLPRRGSALAGADGECRNGVWLESEGRGVVPGGCCAATQARLMMSLLMLFGKGASSQVYSTIACAASWNGERGTLLMPSRRRH